MRFRDILKFWYSGIKMVDFGVSPQRGEKGVTALLALAREGNLPNWWLGWPLGR